MGKKYIIEIGRLERLYKAFVSAHGKPEITWLSPEVDLTPYTEPDMEQVRKEAYQKGYETGYEDGYNEPGKNQQEAYQRGLNDAWECARTIFCTSHGELERIFDLEEDDNGLLWVYHEYTASEAIEKIRQYEQEKDRQARIEYNFDEIKDVLETTANECNVSLDEISEVLQKMKESDNG